MTFASISRRRAEDDDQVTVASYRAPLARPASALFHLDQDHRHVVVLIGGADEGFDLAQDPLAQVGRRRGGRAP